MELYIDLLQVVILIMGILLIILEIALPGVGIPGIVGTILLIVGIFSYRLDFITSLSYLVLALIISLIIGFILTRWLRKTGRLEDVVLRTRERPDEKNPNLIYLGQVGRATTDLRPSGFMDIDKKRIDVITEGEYIEKGREVKVIDVDGSKITVRRV